MNTIGPDCNDIILDYKKTFDLILKQNEDIETVINERHNDISLSKMNILYLDFKKLYLEKNIYNKTIRFTTNCYGTNHYNSRRIFDLDFKSDNDEIFNSHIVQSIHKNVSTKCITISLYNTKYDYNKLDNDILKTIIVFDSDIEITDDNIDDFLV
jgi:hypothetical protein